MSKNQGEGLKKRVKALLGLGKNRAVPTIINDAEEEQEFIITIEKLQVCSFSCFCLLTLRVCTF